MIERRAVTVRRGLAAALVLGCVVIGVPVVLVATGGLPVPHGLPSWSQFVAAVTQTGTPDVVLLQAIAVICWLLWLDLAVAVCAEAIAVARGRAVRLPGFASPLQPFAAQLIAATLLAIAALSIRTTTAPAPGLRAAMAVATARGETLVVAAASAPSPTASQSGSSEEEYVVRRGDTLWAIAQRKLGDALRWPQIFDLNRRRVQPDGHALSNPHWIYPGWVFDLPDDPPRPGATGTSPNGSNGSTPPSSAAGTSSPAAACPTAAATPTGPSATPRPETPRPTPPAVRSPQAPPKPATTVVLPTGDVVGIGLAVAIAAAVGVARLRWRHRSGEDHGARPAYLRLLTPAVRRLSVARWSPVAPGDDDGEDAGAPPMDPADRRDQPGVVSIGELGGQELAVEIGRLSGTGFDGDGAAGVIRHLVVAFLQHASPDRAEVTLIGEFATLAPSAEHVPAVKGMPDWEAALSRLEVELVGRIRTLEEHEVPDFAALTSRCPAEPLSALLVVATQQPDAALRERVRSLVAAVRHLGIGVVFFGPSPLGGTITVAADGAVQHVVGNQMAEASAARLYTLAPSAAADLLAVIAASRSASIVAPALPEATPSVITPPRSEVGSSVRRPVRMSLFVELPEVRIYGDPLDDVLRRVTPVGAPQKDREGLRRKGREVLAFLALHPAGATIETLLAALFPDDDPDDAVVRLRRDIYNVRDVLRRAAQRLDARFIVFGSERYQLNSELIEADVWDVEEGFIDFRAPDASTEDLLGASRRILSAYVGPLLGHASYEWIDPGLRENYVRRVVDVALKRSEVLAHAGDVDGALEAAEKALAVDRDAEALYRRVMELQLMSGHRDAATRTLRELEARLSDIDAEPSEETVRLLKP